MSDSHPLGRPSPGVNAPTRESSEISSTSHTPLLDLPAVVPAGQGGGPPRPMRGDLPADLHDEGPIESPPTVSTSLSTPVAAPGHPRPELSPALSSVLRSAGIGSYPRAEAFLGRAVELPRPSDAVSREELPLVRWLMEQRRVETALRLLNRSGLPPSTLEAGSLRLRCLVCLRRYSAAAEELSRLISQWGEKVPFAARVLGAQLPYLLNDEDVILALDQLQDLARRARSGSSALGGSGPGGRPSLCERLQLLQVLSHLALAAGHASAAADEIEAAAREDSENGAQLLSMLGRLRASEGDVARAEEAFQRAKEAGLAQDSPTALLDQGLLAVARADYKSGRGHFTQASIAAVGSKSPKDLTAVSADEAVSAENNLAVCRLYTTELREGVKNLEAFVKRSPVLFLQNSVVQNLSALYEFMTDGGQRRVTLKEVVGAFQLEDVDTSIFDQNSGS